LVLGLVFWRVGVPVVWNMVVNGTRVVVVVPVVSVVGVLVVDAPL
jgi:hypothetical protein